MLEKYTLKNGIPVFIVENHASPVVSIQAWVKRGSAFEPERLAGISHFLEHALFKGTKKRQVGEIALEIERHGGEINAFTSFEETAYYTTLASRYFEKGLDVIADALQNPSFDPDEMLREREVILEEIKRAQDSPAKMVSTNLWSTCFSDTPFGRPVLGFEKTVSKIDAKVLKRYFEQNYHAGTTAVFIVGDVDKEKALRLVRDKFSRMKRGRSNGGARKVTAPPARSVRVVTIARDIQECHLQIGIPAPEITSPEIPALDLVSSAIGQGESSRLYQRLVKETRLALDVHMGLVATGGCGILTVAMITGPNQLEEALKETVQVLLEAARDGVEEAEVERVRNSLESDVIAGKETVDGYARRLGYYFVQFGDPEYEKKYLEDLLAVDLDEANTAFRDILKKKPVLSLAHPMNHQPDKKRLAAVLNFRPSARPASTERKPLPELTEKGGIQFVIKRVDHLPVVAAKFIFPGGTRTEPRGKEGIANLFHRVWTSGTRSYSALQIARILEGLGASVHGFSGRNSLGLDVEFLSKQWPAIRPILAELLTEPTFPESEFETEKAILLRAIRSEKDSPSNLVHLNFMEAMYPGHPYGRSMLGTEETLASLQASDLRDYFQTHVQKSGLVISSVGSFPSPEWAEELAQLCAPLSSGPAPTHKEVPVTRPHEPRVVVARKDPLYQSHLMIGFLGATFDSPERYPLKLLSSALAGQGGRLFLELRDRQSLAYTVAPLNSDGPVPGMFAFYIGCSPEKLATAIRGIRIEIEKVIDKPLSTAELRRAKQYWLGRFELERQRYGAQATLFGLDQYYGLGHRHSLEVPKIIEAITAGDVQEAARKVLTPEAATFSVVHNDALPEAAVLEAWRV